MVMPQIPGWVMIIAAFIAWALVRGQLRDRLPAGFLIFGAVFVSAAAVLIVAVNGLGL